MNNCDKYKIQIFRGGYKILVFGEESLIIQEIAIKRGWKWYTGSKQIYDTGEKWSVIWFYPKKLFQVFTQPFEPNNKEYNMRFKDIAEFKQEFRGHSLDKFNL